MTTERKTIIYKPDESGIKAAEESKSKGAGTREVIDAYIQNLSDKGRLHLSKQLLYPGIE